MDNKLVTVIGGSGFVGAHLVRTLCKAGWRVRIACRHPHRALHLKVGGAVGQVQLVQANIRMPASIARAVAGADAVVNLTGILFEQGRQKFTSVHARGAGIVAEAAAAAGVKTLLHMSAIGADSAAPSHYARSKGEGEARVRKAFPGAVIVRPSVIFGPGDGLFERFARMAVSMPVLPLINGGGTRFQPVYVRDVAQAISHALCAAEAQGKTYELGGPGIMTLREIYQLVLRAIDRKRVLLPVPFFAARLLGLMGEVAGWVPFVTPFLTRDQVLSLRHDNIADETMPGFADLGVTDLETAEAVVPPYLVRFRHHGQFHEEVSA